MIFMHLTVRTEHSTTIMFVVKSTAEDDLTGAPASTGVAGGEVVQPHSNEMEEMNHNLLGQMGVGKGADNATRSFLDDADATFDLADVFGSRQRIKVHQRDMIADLFKLVVHQEDLNPEPGLVIHPNDAIEERSKV